MAVNQVPDVQSVPYKRSSSFTSDLITFESTWTIKNISLLCSPKIMGQPYISSPIFIAPPDKITTEDKKPVEFQLKFYPKGNTIQNSDFVGVFLDQTNAPGLDIMQIQSIVMANGYGYG